ESGTHEISLVVTDSAGTSAISSESLVVLPSSTGVGSVPVLTGWGGVRMDESASNLGGPPSAVFPGENASNMELSLMLLKARATILSGSTSTHTVPTRSTTIT